MHRDGQLSHVLRPGGMVNPDMMGCANGLKIVLFAFKDTAWEE